MNRGAVLIGIDRYENTGLRTLKAAVTGAQGVAAWATSNGFEVKLLTDERGPVTLRDVSHAVRAFASRTGVDTLDQLLIYFAGHGINKAYSEYWLLSEAPTAPSEAINLQSTVSIARYESGIRHIAFISDACRTAADSIQAQSVEGGIPFPTLGQDKAQDIDRFFAALPGREALEVKDPDNAVNSYEAIYTACLLDALTGKEESIIERLTEDGSEIGVITPRSLDDYLLDEVRRRVARRRLSKSQDPDATVESNYPTYISRVDLPSVEPSGGPVPPSATPPDAPPEDDGGTFSGWDASEADTEPSADEFLEGSTLARMAAVRTDRILLDGSTDLTPSLGRGSTSTGGAMGTLLEADEMAVFNAHGRGHFESQCGFTILGAPVKAAEAPGLLCEFIHAGSDLIHIRVWDSNRSTVRRPSSVLIEFEDGTGCVLPALPEFIGTAIVDRGELANVTYEPSEQTYRWPMYEQAADELRELRAVAAAATRHGVFRVQREDAESLADRVRYLKAIDPTLGLYASYAYDAVGLLDQIRSVGEYLRSDVGGVFFDVAMLERDPGAGARRLDSPDVAPFCPMLSQGWALLPARGVRLPEAVASAGRHLAPSLWTLFRPEGVRLIRAKHFEGGMR